MPEERRKIRDRIRDKIDDNRLARSKSCVGAILAAIAGCLGIICAGLTSFLPGCPGNTPQLDTEPFGSAAMSRTPYNEHVMNEAGMPLRGKSEGPGYLISWATPTNPQGATVAQILGAVKSRVEHLQNTKLGGNEVAKLLFELDEAEQLLIDRPLLETNYGNSDGGAGFAPPDEGIGGIGATPETDADLGSPPGASN